MIRRMIISTSSINSKDFDPCRIISCQPRKKLGKELVNQQSRRDSILSVFACPNSVNL